MLEFCFVVSTKFHGSITLTLVSASFYRTLNVSWHGSFDLIHSKRLMLQETLLHIF